MENMGVSCNVCECIYNCEGNKCRLDKIQVTHEKVGSDPIAVPHFCKSYEKSK